MALSVNERQVELAAWAQQVLTPDFSSAPPAPLLSPVGSDASFRKYYRLQVPQGTLVAVDAPPASEDSHAFVTIGRQLAEAGIRIPAVRAVNYEAGFLLIEDFGDTLLLDILDPGKADHPYTAALEELGKLQTVQIDSLPFYDEAMLQMELGIFSQWFLGELLGLELSGDDQVLLEDMNRRLIDAAMEQPSGPVHRDYHSRNLMVLADGQLGVIDFQGAVTGPLLYDPVSLLKDCYIVWPRAQVEQWLAGFVRHHPVLKNHSFETCLRWFDWIGLQRHLKCLGIFSRVWLRDGKAQYLADIPATFDYVTDVCSRYPELEPLAAWLNKRVAVILAESIDRVRENTGA